MKDLRRQRLAHEPINKLLLRLSAPALVGMTVMALYNVADTIFIGHAVGAAGIAALTLVFPLQMLSLGLGQVTGMGGASLVSRTLGAGSLERGEKALGNALGFALLFGVGLAVLILPAPTWWVRLFGTSPALLSYARDYLEIIMLGSVFRLFAITANNLIRAEGNARVPMIAMVMGACLNVVLDALFILVWHKGVVGAAAATVTAQSVSAFYLFLYYVSGASTLKLRLAAFKPEKAIFSEIFSVGLASFFRSTAMSVVMIFLNRQLLVYGGENAVAALGIMGRLLMLATMPPISLAQGLQPVLGFSYGARNSKRSLASIKLALLYATGYCVVAFGLIMAFPSALAHIFTSDAKLVETAAQAARLMTLCLSLVGFQVVGSVVFQATGKAVPALVTALSRQVLFLLPLIFLLPLWLGLKGLWLAFSGADFLSFLLTLAFFVPEIRAIRRLKPLAPAAG